VEDTGILSIYYLAFASAGPEITKILFVANAPLGCLAVTAYLTKPVRAAILSQQVQQLLGARA
jgi:hypothetical protein